MEENQKTTPQDPTQDKSGDKIKTRTGSGYLKQLYATARTTAGSTHSHLKNLTTILVNFVPVDKVDASELQVRVHFDDTEVQALSESIKQHGVLQPILVVQDGDRYKVIAGERRLRATKLAGLDRIPARVLSTDDKATHEIALRENLDRVDLHPIEEGEGYVSLLETQAYTSHEAIAKAFGKPKSRITECIGFTRLPTETKRELMLRNIKNRALLRHLITLPVESHTSLIQEAAGKEEILSMDGSVTQPGQAGAKAGKKAISLTKPFTYKFDDKGLSVPSFKWKKGTDHSGLQAYADSLKQLLTAIEEELTKPA